MPNLSPPATEARPSVFICYSHDDARIYPALEALAADGVDVWYDKGIRAGSLWRHEIATALERATHVVFFVSKASLESQHCDREMQYAIDHGKTLIPVFLENVELTPSLRIDLGRVQALHGEALTPDELGRDLLASMNGEPVPRRDAVVPSGDSRRRTTSALPDLSIAVAPFKASGSDPADLHVANDLTVGVLDRLSAQRRVRVGSTDTDAVPVSYVLDGVLRRDAARVTTRLIRRSDKVQVWSQTFDIDDSGSLDDEARVIAIAAFAFVDVDVMIERARVETKSAAAFDYYARARMRWAFTAGEVQSPRFGVTIAADFDKALDLDPNFVSALVWRANALINGWVTTPLTFEERRSRARECIERALSLQPNSADALAKLAGIQKLDLDYVASEETLRRLQAIDPDYPWLHENLAHLAQLRGDTQGALRNWELQLQTNGGLWYDHDNYGLVLAYDGQYDRADEAFETAIRLTSRGEVSLQPTLARIWVAGLRGDAEQQRVRFDAAWARWGLNIPGAFVLYMPAVGREGQARQLVAEWDAHPDVVPPLNQFFAHYGLGEYGLAMHWLRRAIEQRDDFALSTVRLPNAYPKIQSLPEFTELLRYLDSIEESH